MYSFYGDNSTKMYYDALATLVSDGDVVSPRGKLVKEIRPASVEFENPYNRVTFLGSRRINPYFQIAESLWILSGRADIQWLTKFNANMAQFSDDGVYVNASYGERLRSYGKNALHNIIVNPVDQMVDAYTKLITDKDTRQAVMVISHPHFDNSKYTIGENGKDIACLSGDTIIHSPEGDLPICELVNKENYPVYSFNESTNTFEIKRVVAGGITRRNAKILKVTLGDGTEIKATPDHRFYRNKYSVTMEPNKTGSGVHSVHHYDGLELVNCEDLKIGDRLPSLLRFTDADGPRIVSVEEVESEDVYDITVEDNHNFFANGYLVHNCNLVITFKIRHDKLNMTVFNRSNDANWGLWGANLCQFSTIQETMLSWLKNSGNEEFENLEIGTYTQLTDSLHIYLDDYGAKCTTDILEYYRNHPEESINVDFNCKMEPRMSLNAEQFDTFLKVYWQGIDPFIMDDSYIADSDNVSDLLMMIADLHDNKVIDDYWYFGVTAMLVYRLHKIGNTLEAIKLLSTLQDCQWKISMMYFMKLFIYKIGKDVEKSEDYAKILELWTGMVSSIESNLLDESWVGYLHEYLDL